MVGAAIVAGGFWPRRHNLHGKSRPRLCGRSNAHISPLPKLRVNDDARKLTLISFPWLPIWRSPALFRIRLGFGAPLMIGRRRKKATQYDILSDAGALLNLLIGHHA